MLIISINWFMYHVSIESLLETNCEFVLVLIYLHLDSCGWRLQHDFEFEGSGLLRRKSSTLKRINSLIDEWVAEASFTEHYRRISCSLNPRRSRANSRRFTPRTFLDKSAFHLSKHSIDNVPVSKVLWILLMEQIISLCTLPSVSLHRASILNFLSLSIHMHFLFAPYHSFWQEN